MTKKTIKESHIFYFSSQIILMHIIESSALSMTVLFDTQRAQKIWDLRLKTDQDLYIYLTLITSLLNTILKVHHLRWLSVRTKRDNISLWFVKSKPTYATCSIPDKSKLIFLAATFLSLRKMSSIFLYHWHIDENCRTSQKSAI